MTTWYCPRPILLNAEAPAFVPDCTDADDGSGSGGSGITSPSWSYYMENEGIAEAPPLMENPLYWIPPERAAFAVELPGQAVESNPLENVSQWGKENKNFIDD